MISRQVPLRIGEGRSSSSPVTWVRVQPSPRTARQVDRVARFRTSGYACNAMCLPTLTSTDLERAPSVEIVLDLASDEACLLSPTMAAWPGTAFRTRYMLVPLEGLSFGESSRSSARRLRKVRGRLGAKGAPSDMTHIKKLPPPPDFCLARPDSAGVRRHGERG